MTTILRWCLVVALNLSSRAASAQWFVDTSHVWSVVECANFGPCVTRYYQFQGDTTLEGKTYGQLHVSSYADMSDADLDAMMREDSNHVVYCYQDTGEFVYYDMSMQVGDTVVVAPIECPWTSMEYVVYEVDSVVLLTGEYRRRWRFWSLAEEWILGIGSNFGPASFETNFCMTDLYPDLNCFTENDTLKYDNDVYPGCDYNTVNVAEQETGHLTRIAPNPFHDSFRILAQEACPNGRVELRDALGRLVLDERADLGSSMDVSAWGLTPGLYQLHFFCGTDRRDVLRVVKQ